MLNIFKKKKEQPENLPEVLEQFKDLKKNFESLAKELERLKKDNLFNIQKVGIVRFNPFSEVGGDQSFSVALLDSKNSGVVITSLYTREGNRVYGKPIKEGKSDYLLSEEEITAMAQANETSARRKIKTQSLTHTQAEAENKNGNKDSKSNNKTAGSGGSGAH